MYNVQRVTLTPVTECSQVSLQDDHSDRLSNGHDHMELQQTTSKHQTQTVCIYLI